MNILILCTGNTCRSPMAEGVVKNLLKKQNRDGVKVSSMGLAAYDGEKPTSHAIEAMKEIGIDITAKRSQRVMLQDLAEVDKIYVMTPSHRDILLDTLPELDDRISVLEIPDPFSNNLDGYRECRDQIVAFFEKEFTSDEG